MIRFIMKLFEDTGIYCNEMLAAMKLWGQMAMIQEFKFVSDQKPATLVKSDNEIRE